MVRKIRVDVELRSRNAGGDDQYGGGYVELIWCAQTGWKDEFR